MEGTGYKNKGDDCGTFIGYESSTNQTNFIVDDYEVYEIKDEWNDKKVLIKKEKEIKEKLNELTKMKIKKLLYRGSKDGFKSKDFHSKCDGHKSTIVVIKIKNGDIIGGYTSAKWESSDKGVRDDKAFLFSLTKNKKYKIKEDQKKTAIYMKNDYGPLFGGIKYTLVINNECNNNNKSYSQLGMKYTGYENNEDDCGTFIGYESSKKETNFIVDDYEVYEVEDERKNKKVLVKKEEKIIEKINQLTKMKIKTLLYRGSKDGFKSVDFHSKCDGHSNTITIIKVNNGDIIGGYLSVPWESSTNGKYVKDNKTFLFSITKNKIYEIKKDQNDYYTVFMSSSYGPTFGYGPTLQISDECNNNKISYNSFGIDKTYENNGDDCGTFIGYKSSKDKINFTIDDYEVYEIEDEWNDKNVLINKEKEIKEDLKKLTNIKIKTLLYRGSKDGFKAEDFHKKCDGHSNTITIIKVKDGDIIGGYLSVPWESSWSGKYVKDDKTFLFSITKNKIYKIKEDQKDYAIYMRNEYGPTFGGSKNNTLHISNECNNYKYSCIQLGMEDTGYENNEDDCGTFIGYKSSKDKTNFIVDDYEVYEVEIDEWNDKNVLINKEEEIIEKINQLTNIKIKSLLYRGSKDGFKSEDFHSKCDGNSNTIIIIKVNNGDIIGGYLSVPWESPEKGKWIKDNKAFLFSLTK